MIDAPVNDDAYVMAHPAPDRTQPRDKARHDLAAVAIPAVIIVVIFLLCTIVFPVPPGVHP